jgi:hypothetical protein
MIKPSHPGIIGFIKINMGAHLMLNTPNLRHAQIGGRMGLTADAMMVRAGHSECPRSSFMGRRSSDSLEPSNWDLSLHGSRGLENPIATSKILSVPDLRTRVNNSLSTSASV